LTNGHINAGGEIEKRKAFSQYANDTMLDDEPNPGPYQAVFGLESTDSGLQAYGSALPYTGAARPHTLGQSMLTALLTPVNYIQLAHPAVLEGATYDPTKHRMTGVVFSTNMSGKAFVCAQFNDTYKFLYYNGVLVHPSRNGLVLTGRVAAANLATELAAELNALGWSGVATSNYVDAKSPIGVTNVTYSPTDTDATNNMEIQHIQDASPGVVGQSATAQLAVTGAPAAGDTIAITAPDGSGGAGVITILPTLTLTTAQAASTTTVANAIVAGINSTVTIPKYTAAILAGPNTNYLIVSGPLGNVLINTGGAIPNMVVTYTGGVTFGSSGYTGSASPSEVDNVPLLPAGTPIGNRILSTPSTVAKPVAGTGPFTYLWQYVSGDTTLTIVNPLSNTTNFRGTVRVNDGGKSAIFRCQITDSTSAIVYTNNVMAFIEATTTD
jgi:hypothetical protein